MSIVEFTTKGGATCGVCQGRGIMRPLEFWLHDRDIGMYKHLISEGESKLTDVMVALDISRSVADARIKKLIRCGLASRKRGRAVTVFAIENKELMDKL